METLIVSGGNIQRKFIRSYISEHPCEFTIAVDSGMQFFYEENLTPDYIVGDFDSADPKILHFFQAMEGDRRPVILQFQQEKDETDTELAIRTAIRQGGTVIHLLGATGSRIDHIIGNLHLLGAAMRMGADCRMVDACNRIRMVERGLVIRRKEQYGDYVSLFPFTSQVKGLTLKGFKYPLDGYTLESFHSLGVSNEIVEEEAEISFQEGVLLVAESRDLPSRGNLCG